MKGILFPHVSTLSTVFPSLNYCFFSENRHVLISTFRNQASMPIQRTRNRGYARFTDIELGLEAIQFFDLD